MFNIGTGELLVIALVALIVLGPDKLPKAARQVGQFTAEARKIANGFRQEMQHAMDEVARTADTDTDAGAADDHDPPRRLSAPPSGAEPIDVPAAEARPLASPRDLAAGNGANGANGAGGSNGSNGPSSVTGEPDDPARS